MIGPPPRAKLWGSQTGQTQASGAASRWARWAPGRSPQEREQSLGRGSQETVVLGDGALGVLLGWEPVRSGVCSGLAATEGP